MESQPQNPEFRINPENFHPCRHLIFGLILPLHQYFVYERNEGTGGTVHMRRFNQAYTIC